MFLPAARASEGEKSEDPEVASGERMGTAAAIAAAAAAGRAFKRPVRAVLWLAREAAAASPPLRRVPDGRIPSPPWSGGHLPGIAVGAAPALEGMAVAAAGGGW